MYVNFISQPTPEGENDKSLLLGAVHPQEDLVIPAITLPTGERERERDRDRLGSEVESQIHVLKQQHLVHRYIQTYL